MTPRPLAATIAFIATGVAAAIAVAALAIGLALGIVPIPAAILTALALAAGVVGITWLIDLAQRPYPISLDCLDSQHDACLLCGCTCHKDPR